MPIARDRIASTLAFAVFLAFLIIVGVRHEPWFDEAQAWLIARDTTPWSLVTTGVRYEGTPALWHLLLQLAQHLGLPYGGLWLVSGALASGGAWLVLNRSPFPLMMRVGLIFSYFFAYQYAVVARSYALDLLLLPLLAQLYPTRTERPMLYAGVLALAANTNAHSFVVSAVLATELAFALRARLLAFDRKALLAVAMFGVLAIAAALQAWPPKDINFIIPKRSNDPFVHTLTLITEAFIDRGDVWATVPPTIGWRLVGAVATIFVVTPAVMLWAEAKTLLLAAAMFVGLLLFSVLKYGNYWHAGIIFLAFVFCTWISWRARAALSPAAQIWLMSALGVLVAFQVWCALVAGARDFQTPYSSAPAVARALIAQDQRHPHETLGVAGFKAFAVAPWFSRNIFANYEGGAAHPIYYLWRRPEEPIPGLSEDHWRRTMAAGYDRLLLSTFNVMGWNGPARYIADAHKAGYCPTAVFSGAMIWKTYALETDDMMLFDRCATWTEHRKPKP